MTTSDPMNTEPMNTEPMNTEPMNTEPMNTEPSNTDPVSTDPYQPDQATTTTGQPGAAPVQPTYYTAPQPAPMSSQPMSVPAPYQTQPLPHPGYVTPATSVTPAASVAGTTEPGAPSAGASFDGTVPPSIPPAFLSQAAPQPAAQYPAPVKEKKSRLGVAIVSTAVIAALAASGVTAFAVTQLPSQSTTQDGASSLSQLGAAPEAGSGSSSSVTSPNWESVAASVRDAVVAIDVTGNQEEGEGSGVIISDKGYVLTNNHVVSIGSDIKVTLTNGTVHAAKVVGTDSTTDLAVIQIQKPPSDLKVAALGDSSAVKVGQSVMAIGNPLGLDNTVTSGIVSAVNRPVTTSSSDSDSSRFSNSTASQVVTNAIQVDAAINPGNSGGPLFDGSGNVIGINSSIATLASGMGSDSSSGSIGLGFAIPINLAKSIATQLIDSGTAKHAYLGVTLSDSTAEIDGVTRQGAKVESVSSSTPAAKADIQKGDVIVGIDGNAVSGATSLTAFVRSYAVGDSAKLTLVRDGKALDVTATFAEAPATLTAGQNQQGQEDQQGQGQQGQDDQQGQGQQDQNQNPFDPFGLFGDGQ